MGKFACRPMAEKLVNLPVSLWRRNWLIWKWGNGVICLSAFGGEIIQFENWLICLSAFGGEIG
jgi:hypothetical protein